MHQVVVNIDEADLRRVEQTLAEEEAKLASVTDRKTRAGNDLFVESINVICLEV